MNAGCRAWLSEHASTVRACLWLHVWCVRRLEWRLRNCAHVKTRVWKRDEPLADLNRVYCVTHMSILSQMQEKKKQKVQSFRSEPKYHH